MNYEDLLIELGPRGTMGGGGLSDVDPNSWESQEPPESTMLWKYMSFSKFISLLTKKALFFSLVRKMEDKYEGFIHAPRRDNSENKELCEVEHTVHEILSEMKQNTIVSCWTESEHESNVMWRSYTGVKGEGIAIKTTYRDLLESVCPEAKPFLTSGEVKYLNYNQDDIPINSLAPLFHKRIEFKSEEEVRVAAALSFELKGTRIVIDPDIEKNGGLYIQVDLNRLINEVVVSPNSDPWFNELVSQQVEQSSLKACVVPSTI